MEIPDCMSAEKFRSATIDDEHLRMLSEYVSCGWSSMRAEICKLIHLYWSFRDEIVVIDGIALKGERIMITVSL